MFHPGLLVSQCIYLLMKSPACAWDGLALHASISLPYFHAITYKTLNVSVNCLEISALFNTTNLADHHSVHLRLLHNTWYGWHFVKGAHLRSAGLHKTLRESGDHLRKCLLPLWFFLPNSSSFIEGEKDEKSDLTFWETFKRSPLQLVMAVEDSLGAKSKDLPSFCGESEPTNSSY